jgi:colanic acid/amylovoran biosynthesis glycosyltransferase
MNVAHIIPTWLPQTQTWMYNQIRFLPAEVEAHILCERTENLDQFWLRNIHSLSEAPFWRRRSDAWLRRIAVGHYLSFQVIEIQRRRADILHSHFGNIGWQNIRTARSANLKHIVSFYGFDVSYLPKLDPSWTKRYEELFATVDTILCEGCQMAASVERLGCPRDKIRIHHLGVSLSEIPFKPRVWDGKQPLKVLIAASFQEKKGIPYALEALSRLGDDVPIEITVIGDANDEMRSKAEKAKIVAALQRHELERNTRLLGYQPHRVCLEEAYGHHVYVSPSVTAGDGDTEGGVPVTLIEMAATGMPVISTWHCDIPEVIEHNVTGMLAPERNVNELVRVLFSLVERPDRWSSITAASRRHLEHNYDARKQGDKLAGIYRELSA